MPAPRSIAITFDGSDQLSVQPLWAWQANPLTITAALASGLTLLTGAANIVAQIHATAVAAGATPLAEKTVAATGAAWTFDFTTAEMAFSIGAGVVSAHRFLFVSALDAAGDEIQTLYARRIEIKAATSSEIVPDVTPASAVLRLLSATPDDDGMVTVSALGVSIRIPFSPAP